MLLFIDLDDANQRLVFDFRVVVKNHVELFINRANTLSEYLLKGVNTILRKLNVLTGGYASLLKDLLTLSFKENFVRVSKCPILPFLFDRALKNFAFI